MHQSKPARKVLITGSNGMLGTYLISALGSDFDLLGIGRRNAQNPAIQYAMCDIRNEETVRNIFRDSGCRWVIHAAGMTDVDACETNPTEAYETNVTGSQNIARAAHDADRHAILISTDYVFDGRKPSPYEESDSTKPINVYGRTKAKAEEVWTSNLPHGIILRTSWLFGRNGKNFVRTIADKALLRQSFAVVGDQWGSPTYAHDLAEAIKRLIQAVEQKAASVPTVLHFANDGATSRYEWARYITDRCGGDPDLIKPVSSNRNERPAMRPERGILSNALWKKVFKEKPRNIWWATDAYLKEEMLQKRAGETVCL